MMCPKCGFHADFNFDFCPNCGAKITNDETNELTKAFSSMIEEKEQKRLLREKLLKRFDTAFEEKKREDAFEYLEQYRQSFGADCHYYINLLRIHSNGFEFKDTDYDDKDIQSDIKKLQEENFLEDAHKQKGFSTFYQKFQYGLPNNDAYKILDELDKHFGCDGNGEAKSLLNLINSFEKKYPSLPHACILRIYYFSKGYKILSLWSSEGLASAVADLKKKCSFAQLEMLAEKDKRSLFRSFLNYAKNVVSEYGVPGMVEGFSDPLVLGENKNALNKVASENEKNRLLYEKILPLMESRDKYASAQKDEGMDVKTFLEVCHSVGKKASIGDYSFRVVERSGDKAFLVCYESPFLRIRFDFRSYPAYLGNTPKTFLNGIFAPNSAWRGHYYNRFLLDYAQSSARLFLNNGFLHTLDKNIKDRIVPFSDGNKVKLLSKEEIQKYMRFLKKGSDSPFTQCFYNDYFLRDVNNLKTLPLFVTDDGDIGGEGYDWEFRRTDEPEGLSLKWGSDESSILALLKIRVD